MGYSADAAGNRFRRGQHSGSLKGHGGANDRVEESAEMENASSRCNFSVHLSQCSIDLKCTAV